MVVLFVVYFDSCGSAAEDADSSNDLFAFTIGVDVVCVGVVVV